MQKINIVRSYICILFFLLWLLIPAVAKSQPQPSDLSASELLKTVINIQASDDFKENRSNSRELFGQYLQELIDRSKTGQPDAVFHYALYQYVFCKIIKTNGIDVSTSPLCKQTFQSMKSVAENEKIRPLFISTEAMSILGEMYRDGIGTEPSRYLSADWFIECSIQRYKNQDREGSLRALESALNLVPDHPKAIELRKELLRTPAQIGK